MYKSITVLAFILVIVVSCKSKKADDTTKEDIFPVMSFLKGQIKHIDTSLYSIREITFQDSTHMDTTFIKREQFRDAAKDFLALPDLTESQYKGRFTEEKMFDAGMNRVILSCTPKDPEKEDIQRQEVLIIPDPANGDKVKSIIVDLAIENKDSSIQKKDALADR